MGKAGRRADDARRAAHPAFHHNYVLGTGCDLPGETPLENIDALMEARA